MATMQALQLTKPSPTSPATLSLVTLSKPVPTHGQLLVRVHASAIHPSDILNSKGLFPYTTYPRIPGRDFSGTVVSPPTHPLYNKPVYGTSGNSQAFTVDGAQAEYIAVSEKGVALKPENLSWVQAARVGVPFTTASLVLRKAGLKEGESVLILGANGAVGRAVGQLALARGAKVFRGMRNDEGDVNTAADPGLSKIDELTGGKGVDIVVDTVGQPALTGAAVKKLGRDGRLVFIAAPRGGSEVLGVEMLEFYRLQKTVVGVNSLLYGVEEMASELEALRVLFESGKLAAAREGEWKEVKLSEGAETYKKAGERGAGKFVLVMN